MGPEVLLKAVSMAANTGKAPNKITVADFDLRPFVFDENVRENRSITITFAIRKALQRVFPRFSEARDTTSKAIMQPP